MHGVADRRGEHPQADRPASYPSTDYEPDFGPMDVMEVWGKVASADSALKLTERESSWMNATLEGKE